MPQKSPEQQMDDLRAEIARAIETVDSIPRGHKDRVL